MAIYFNGMRFAVRIKSQLGRFLLKLQIGLVRNKNHMIRVIRDFQAKRGRQGRSTSQHLKKLKKKQAVV